MDIPNKKKVFIICCLGEYKYVFDNLHKLINLKEEEFIIPYGFLQYDKLTKAINCTAEILAYKLDVPYDEVKETTWKEFLHFKNKHFKTLGKEADEIIILLPEHAQCEKQDIDEKNQEIEACGTKEFKNKKIRTINLLKKEKQKVIKLDVNPIWETFK